MQVRQVVAGVGVAQPTTLRVEDVVEVTPYFPSWLVVGSDLPALWGGHLLRERGLLDASCHLKLLLYALALHPLLLQTLLHQCLADRSRAPLLGDLAPLYAVDEDGIVGCHSAGRRHAQKLLSIVGGAPADAAHHLVCFGYLLLEHEAGVGKGGMILEGRPLETFTVELLGGKHPHGCASGARSLGRGLVSVAEEVGSKHLVQRVHVQLTSCLEQTAYQGLVVFSLRRHSSFLLLVLLPSGVLTTQRLGNNIHDATRRGGAH